jgi:predicted alpha/beta-fold hydrolase
LKSYNLAQDLRKLKKQTDKIIDFQDWLARKVNQSGFKSFNTIQEIDNQITQTILNYFDKNKWIRNKLGRILLK